jgi:hypothetical protein
LAIQAAGKIVSSWEEFSLDVKEDASPSHPGGQHIARFSSGIDSIRYSGSLVSGLMSRNYLELAEWMNGAERRTAPWLQLFRA